MADYAVNGRPPMVYIDQAPSFGEDDGNDGEDETVPAHPARDSLSVPGAARVKLKLGTTDDDGVDEGAEEETYRGGSRASTHTETAEEERPTSGQPAHNTYHIIELDQVGPQRCISVLYPCR